MLRTYFRAKAGSALSKAKGAIYDSLILNGEIRQKEQLAERVLIELWHIFTPVFFRESGSSQQILKEVPEEVLKELAKHSTNLSLSEENIRVRLLCDFLSGMTDRYCLDLWERLCSPLQMKKAS